MPLGANGSAEPPPAAAQSSAMTSSSSSGMPPRTLLPSSNTPANRKVNKSCLECTRRKVRCDGDLPCSSCVYYRTPNVCAYRQRSKRHAVSRSTYDKTSDQLRTYGYVLSLLYPGIDPASLADKTREELISLLSVSNLQDANSVSSHDAKPGVHPQSTAGGPSFSLPAGEHNDSAAVSETDEPAAERHWEENLDHTGTQASDDINAIGLATDHHARSYLGSTSMSAVLSTIFRLCPAAKDHAAQCSQASAPAPPQPAPTISSFSRDPALGLLKEQRCIDFYFEHVHAIGPFLDEQEFRAQYALGTRQDASWMGLLNMVFAMGAIASGSDSLHEQYYRQARSFMSLDCLGAGNLETLQALCLLGGHYLHYRNSPNMAYGVLGAAHRVAIALGLHREPRRKTSPLDPVEADRHRKRLENRRRTWWGLLCLDTYATMTQGRPTCGRWDSGTMDTLLPQKLHPEDHAAIWLETSSRFCMICGRIQHRYAQRGRLTMKEILEFDAELIAWHDNLPDFGSRSAGPSPQLNVSRDFIRNKYYHMRVILSRSSILYLGQDLIRKSEHIASEHQQMVDLCTRIACDAIDAIALYWTPNRMHVWNSAWCLFQACTTPLLLLALEKNVHHPLSTDSGGGATAWHGTLSKALETFSEMRPWMRASDRSPDIVAALYEALTSDVDGFNQTPSATDGSNFDLFGWCDEQLTELDWSVFLGDQSMTQGMIPFS